MISSLILLGCLVQTKDVRAFPSTVAALGRPLSWDPKGAYALDVDRPFTPASKEIVRQLTDAELGRAEALSRRRLKVDRDDLVPAWALAQILRVRRTATEEYRRFVQHQIDSPASLPVLLYRFHVCRIAENELAPSQRGSDSDAWVRYESQLKRLRDRLLPAAKANLGIAVALSQRSPYWATTSRKILEEYREANSNVEVRPLLCQAYLSGVHYRMEVEDSRGKFVPAVIDRIRPEEPQPQKSLEIALSLTKECPEDGLGHFYVAVSQSYLKKPDLALREMKLAVKTGHLPPFYESTANRFVKSPVASSLIAEPIPY